MLCKDLVICDPDGPLNLKVKTTVKKEDGLLIDHFFCVSGTNMTVNIELSYSIFAFLVCGCISKNSYI